MQTTKAYLTIFWGSGSTRIEGPYADFDAAKDCATDAIQEDETHASVIGPLPYTEVVAPKDFYGMIAAMELRPSELKALHDSIEVFDSDDSDKKEAIATVYAALMGEPI